VRGNALRGIALLALLATGACRDRAQQEQQERQQQEAAAGQHAAHDAATLRHLVELDQALDRALKEADDASGANDDARAASLLETKAAPAADAALAFARATPAETPSGQARLQAMVSVMEDRRAEIPKYAAALRGTDLDAKLASVEAQLALQKRAMTAASAALQTGEAPSPERAAP
jgi:hypothetical protein